MRTCQKPFVGWASPILGRCLSPRHLLVAFCILECFACAETTQIRVDIVGDFEVPEDIERLVVEFRGEEVTFQTSHELRPPRRRLYESLVLYPGSVLNERVAIRVGGHEGGRRVALGTGSMTLIPKQSQTIELRLARDEETPIVSSDENEVIDNGNLTDALYMRWLEHRHDAP